MNYKELMEKSREVMGTKLCKSCPVCDGRACRNTMPGPGAKGIGDVAMRNYDAWKNVRVNMDTITDNEPVSTELELFGHTFLKGVSASCRKNEYRTIKDYHFKYTCTIYCERCNECEGCFKGKRSRS